MECRHRKLNMPHPLDTPVKKKRSDLGMGEDKGGDDKCALLGDTVTVNYPLILVTGELLGGSARDGQPVCVSNDDVNHGMGSDEVKGRNQVDIGGLTIHGNAYGLPNFMALISDGVAISNDQQLGHGTTVNKDRQRRSGEINDGQNLSYQLSNHMVSSHNHQIGHSLKWPVSLSGKTKIFVPLRCGENIVSFQIGEKEICSMKINYSPLENKRFVRPVYIVCANSDGTFEAPPGVDNSVDSAKERLSFNARLLQTFTAEQLNLHGFGRKTFRLEEDETGNVKVNVFYSKLDLNKALEMSGNGLYDYFHEELNQSELYDPLCKFWVFMSCTRYMPPKAGDSFDEKKVPQYVKGHTALGGGNLALFGTGCLHTWARNLEELFSRFTDNRKIDKKTLFDDSANRTYHWANYSTTLGAAMHELGHTFNLPHTPSGIMGRGFDDMNIFFVGDGEPARNSIEVAGRTIDIYKDKGAHWHRSSAAILSCSRWIGGHRDDRTPCEVFAPIMFNSSWKRGPLGSGSDGSGNSFSSDEWLRARDLGLRGFRIRAKKYIHAIEVIGAKKETRNDEIGNSSDGILSQWFGDQQTDAETHEFMLDNDEERLMSIDVRAGSWLDAVRFHSSHKSTAWIGGKGGDLYNLSFGDCNGFDDIFGTAGDEFITSIGIARNGKSEDENYQRKCYFYSHYGIRVVEVRQQNGEVMKHWEFLDGEAQRDVCILTEDLFLDKAQTVGIYDGNGECAVYNIANFKHNFEVKP